MPSQSSSMSEACGDDQQAVGLLPIHDNEFAELLRFIQPSSNAGDWPSRNESFASTFTLKSNVSDHSPILDAIPEMNSSNHGESHGDHWAAVGFSDSDNEYATRWGSMDDVQGSSRFILTDTQIPEDERKLSDMGYLEDSWFNQMPTTSTLSWQSPKMQSSDLQINNQEELNWTDYLCLPGESSVSLEDHNAQDFATENNATAESTISPAASSPGSSPNPPAPNQQIPPNAVSKSPRILSTTANPTSSRSSSIQKRQRTQSIATAPLRPKFSHILPNPNQNSVTSPHIPAISMGPTPDAQSPIQGRGAKRSSQTGEEGLQKRRNYQRVAEQSRRLRLNSALKDLEALLPSKILHEEDQLISPTHQNLAKKDKKKATSVEQTKAHVMELAIEYIKTLRTTLDEKNMRMRELGVTAPSMLL